MKTHTSSVSFQFGKNGFAFIPNTNFWLLILLAFGGMIYFAISLLEQNLSMRASLGLGTPEIFNFLLWEELENSTGRSLMAGNIFVAISAMINFVLRKLINIFLKANNIMLLTQAKVTRFQNTPMTLKLGGQSISFKPNNKLWYSILTAFVLVIGSVAYLHHSNSQMQAKLSAMEMESEKFDEWFTSQNYKEDVMGYFLDYFNAYNKNQESIQQNYREAFQIQKQLMITQYLIKHKASRLDQLSTESMLEMNRKISELFKELVLDKQKMEAHVKEYFSDTTDLNKIVTALMEQGKFHVPASIKLAQSALETAYGRRVVNNNYFGIKDKTHQSSYMETTEYFNAAEVKANSHIILSKHKVNKGGKTLYKCKVRDSFVDYNSPWASFRAHSIYLVNNNRYAPLFTNGKNYEAWADKIGSTKHGGVGYATSPIYGNLLKKIIKRYNLDLLDY